MSNEPNVNELWQSQPVEKTTMSLIELQNKSFRFQGRIRLRNALEYSAGAVAILFYGFLALRAPAMLTRIGAAICVTGIVFVMYRLFTRGAARGTPPDLGLSPCLDFHRRELERQRDLLKNVLSWYIAPILPGWGLVTLSGAIGPKTNISATTIYACFAGLFFYGVWKWNQKAAARIQSQIDELTESGKQ